MRLFLFASLLAVLAGCGKSNTGEKPNPKGHREYTQISVEALSTEWAANPSAAAEKYKDNGVLILGVLKEINSNLSNETYIDVRDSMQSKSGTHIFVLSKEAKDGLNRCKIGKAVVLRARASGNVAKDPWLVVDEIAPGE